MPRRNVNATKSAIRPAVQGVNRQTEKDRRRKSLQAKSAHKRAAA